MSTWETMWREILANSGRPAGDAQKAKFAIVDAIDKHRDKGYFFNEARYLFSTIEGQSGYGEDVGGFPRGLVTILGGLVLHVEQDADNPYGLHRVTVEELIRMRELQGEGSGARMQPECWSFLNGKVELFPTPDSTVHDVVLFAIADAGTLTRKYVSSAFKFYDLDGNDLDAAEYPAPGQTNHWFGPGYSMIRCYAEYTMYAGQLHAQAGQTERLLQRYVETEQVLANRSNRMSAPRYIEPMDLGW